MYLKKIKEEITLKSKKFELFSWRKTKKKVPTSTRDHS